MCEQCNPTHIIVHKYIPVPKKLTVENILPARIDLCSLMHTMVDVLLSKQKSVNVFIKEC